MRVLVFARDMRLASGVKDWFDQRHVGLTCAVEISDPARTVSAVTGLEPSVVVIVCRSIDRHGFGVMPAAWSEFRCDPAADHRGVTSPRGVTRESPRWMRTSTP